MQTRKEVHLNPSDLFMDPVEVRSMYTHNSRSKSPIKDSTHLLIYSNVIKQVAQGRIQLQAETADGCVDQSRHGEGREREA